MKDDDDMEGFSLFHAKKLVEAKKSQSKLNKHLIDLEYDSDDNPIIKKKDIEVLAPLDHVSIQYEPFKKALYKEAAKVCRS